MNYVRIRINYFVDVLPIAFRMGIVSLIKEALKRSDKQYYNSIFDEKNKIRPFSFASYLHKPIIVDDTIQLEKISITVSSANPEFILHLYNGLNDMDVFSYKNTEWRKKKIEMLKEKEITSSTVVFKTLSSLLIEDKAGNPLTPYDQEYQKQFNYYANLMMNELYGRDLIQEIRILDHRLKKTVIKEANQEWIEKKEKQFMYFTTYRGLIKLHGASKDLMAIYQSGISRRRSQGYGLLEIERMEVNK